MWLQEPYRGRIGLSRKTKRILLCSSPGALDDYRNDEQRAEEADLLKRIEDLEKAGKPGSVPCFFKEVDGKVVAFGHTRNFRMCYRHRVHDHLPAAHKPENRSEKYDMANVIFGKVGKFAGRVFFEDAWLIGNPTDSQMDEIPPDTVITQANHLSTLSGTI